MNPDDDRVPLTTPQLEAIRVVAANPVGVVGPVTVLRLVGEIERLRKQADGYQETISRLEDANRAISAELRGHTFALREVLKFVRESHR